MTDSILLPELRGVVFITGRRGVGKSFFCATAENPDLVCYLDYEAKGESLHEQLHFGAYHSVTEKAVNRGPLGIWNETEKIIREIPQNRFTVAVIDNVSPLELGLNAEANRDVARYVKDFGLNLKNVQEGRFGGLKSVVNFLVTEKIAAPLHARGVKLILVVSHIGAKWGTAGPIPNKYSVKGADRWQELSMMTLILTPGEYAPIPAAIVQKEQLGQLSFDVKTGTFAVRRRLPLRIPQCDWEHIRYYMANPADLRKPAPGETPTAFETEQFSEDLSKEQLAIMVEQIRAQREENAMLNTMSETITGLDPNQDKVDAIRAYLEKNPNATNEEVKANVPGADIVLIVKAKRK